MASGAGWERGGDGVTLDRPVVLAVSGGADSMVLAAMLHARSPRHVVALATFDHGTGAAASEAVKMVQAWGAERGMPVRAGSATGLSPTESAWRRARWAFLRTVSESMAAPIATAHTEDDQAETVFIRLLRSSGVRGLAGLLGRGPVLRPLLGVSRQRVRAWAEREQVPFRDDPSNADLRYLRNRVRLELLPAIERTTPGFRDWLLALGRQAADWRGDVAAAVDRHWHPEVDAARAEVLVPRDPGRTPEREEAALFWPEVAGRVEVTLDRRGTARLASFTTKRVAGLRMPLAGGAIVTTSRAGWSLQRAGVSCGGGGQPERLAPPEW
jgi:tRNA(Ile)-lysidine synthase